MLRHVVYSSIPTFIQPKHIPFKPGEGTHFSHSSLAPHSHLTLPTPPNPLAPFTVVVSEV